MLSFLVPGSLSEQNWSSNSCTFLRSFSCIQVKNWQCSVGLCEYSNDILYIFFSSRCRRKRGFPEIFFHCLLTQRAGRSSSCDRLLFSESTLFQSSMSFLTPGSELL